MSTLNYLTKFGKHIRFEGRKSMPVFSCKDGKVFEILGDDVYMVGSRIRFNPRNNAGAPVREGWQKVSKVEYFDKNHMVHMGKLIGFE